jgi:opacity protein-like surface antigen
LRSPGKWTPYYTTTLAGLEQRAYNRVSDRNGQYYSAGQYGRFFFGEAGHQFLIGASYLGAATDKNRYDYDGWQALARFDFKLPYNFTLSPYASFGQEYYNGPATALETRDRRDDRRILGTDLTYAINDAWSLEFGYQYRNTDSTSNLYTYDQHVARMGVAWSF